MIFKKSKFLSFLDPKTSGSYWFEARHLYDSANARTCCWYKRIGKTKRSWRLAQKEFRALQRQRGFDLLEPKSLPRPASGRIVGSFGKHLDRKLRIEFERKGLEIEARAGTRAKSIAELYADRDEIIDEQDLQLFFRLLVGLVVARLAQRRLQASLKCIRRAFLGVRQTDMKICVDTGS